ncbi:angiopoietin-related protein 1-like [Anopheles cruzii]|uniref:angiopoietin-related protein 1-like n=1 Tax=Anopheles cruzii TaxID=68878 RepID=UPI0022EC1D34|nr:angiopoietin-related protein 1-like [Anopheles cruzii]
MVPLAGIIFLCIAAGVRCTDTNSNSTNFSGFAFEVLMAKVNHMQRLFVEHQLELSEQQVDTNNSLNTMREAILDLQFYMPLRSCKEVPQNVSGVYSIRLDFESSPFKVYCEQTKFGGGWLVIHNEIFGSLDFNRNWTEYRDGFGDIGQEFWIGLERLHQLTSRRPYELMIERATRNDGYTYGRYAAFEIGSETEQYQLKTIGAYSGPADDLLTRLTDMEFSTYDRDNDKNFRLNCAETYRLGWWFNSCWDRSQRNVNFFRMASSRTDYYPMFTYARMMIRPIK